LLPLALFGLFVLPWIVWKCFIRRRDGDRKKREAERKLRVALDAVDDSLSRSPSTVSSSVSIDDGQSAASTIGSLGTPLLFMDHKEISSDSPQRSKKRRGGAGGSEVVRSPSPNGLTHVPSMTIDFHFNDLGLKLKTSGATVLAGVTGRILHGRVTAVMGPSGAGKTTFLSTLSGKASYGVQTGEILINGKKEPLAKYRKITGFVPQEDIMHRMLTVKEILTYAAQARLPRETSAAAKGQRVNETIAALGLTDIRHSTIGDETTRGISGGQRKRVNIGMELVGQPTVLFLDEPTSGLDSTSSKEVCHCLRRVAESGLTIVTVIHQPRYEIFEMFHDVLLLGKGGRTVYLYVTCSNAIDLSCSLTYWFVMV
jgi:ABC-type multidrug transport system ATPase subunit